MAKNNTYTQVYIQFVFAVKYRQALISPKWEEELHKFITSVVKTQNHLLISINSVPDHIHILVGMRPHQAPSDLMSIVKSKSSLLINEKKWTKTKFRWQEGFGGFSYSKSHVDNVIRYIENQKEHHKITTFKEEYLDDLQRYDVDFDPKYVFKDPI